MIVGTGADIVEVGRIARLRQRWGERGERRLFAAGELEYCRRLSEPEPSLALRFAAKEAFFKALGTGVGQAGRWREVEVERPGAGPPRLRLHGRAAESAHQRGIRQVHLALSHTRGLALAFVVLEG